MRLSRREIAHRMGVGNVRKRLSHGDLCAGRYRRGSACCFPNVPIMPMARAFAQSACRPARPRGTAGKHGRARPEPAHGLFRGGGAPVAPALRIEPAGFLRAPPPREKTTAASRFPALRGRRRGPGRRERHRPATRWLGRRRLVDRLPIPSAGRADELPPRLVGRDRDVADGLDPHNAIHLSPPRLGFCSRRAGLD